MALTVLHLGAELALFGILKDRVVAGICAFHCTVTAGLVKEGAISTWSSAATQGCLSQLTCVNFPPTSEGFKSNVVGVGDVF